MQSPVAQNRQNLETEPKQVKYIIGLGALVFGISLLTALSFHFSALPPNKTLCFDARQYFFDTQRLTEFLLAVLHGHWQAKLISDQQFLTAILSDGPAFPGVFAFLFTLCGHVPEIQDCKLIEIFQSIMHASSALLVFSLSFFLTRRQVPSLISGLCWGLYPAAIFWSGIFYTETTVIFFSLLFALMLVRSSRLKFAFAAGVFGGTVALLKPALLPAAALASLLALRKRDDASAANKSLEAESPTAAEKKRKKALFNLDWRTFFTLAAGAIIIISPWICYTKLLTGSARFTAQRFPAFNLAMGSDTEVDACLVSPAPPLTTMFSHDDEMPLAFPLSQWQFHTTDCLRLAAVKLSALWSKQTNDFRESFLGFSPEQQNGWHRFLFFCGLSGLFLFVWNWRLRKLSSSESTVGLTALIFLLSHLSYVLFTPAARYGLTSMPFMIIFVAYAFAQIPIVNTPAKPTRGNVPTPPQSKPDAPLKNSASPLKLLLALSMSALCVCALVQAGSLSKIFSPVETSHILTHGDTAVKEFDFSKVRKPLSEIYTVLILVDGNASIKEAQLEINGHKIEGKLRHIRDFDSTLYLQSFELRSLGYPANIDTDHFRHWQAIAVAPEWLNWGGKNIVRVSGGKSPEIIYGDPGENRHMLSTKYFSVNSLCNSERSLELRIPEPVTTGNVTTSSQLTDASGTTHSLSDSLRIRLGVVLGQPYIPRQDKTTLSKSVSPKQFDLYIQDPTVDGLRANRINLKAARSMGATIELPTLPSADNMIVRVEGDLRRTQERNRPSLHVQRGEGSAEVVVALQPSQQNSTVVLNLSPATIPYSDNWTHFLLEDRVPTKLLSPEKKSSIYIAVYPGRWLDYCGYVPDKNCGDVQFSHLHYEICAASAPDVANKTILFY